jgi:uncharacterized protein YbaP (TraB family)
MRKLILAAMVFIAANCTAQNKYPSTLWQITHPKLKKTSYLFGTYHISTRGVFKLSDSLFYALKNVDVVAGELNIDTWQDNSFTYDQMVTAYNGYTGRNKPDNFAQNTLTKTNTIEKLPIFIAYVSPVVNYYLYRNSETQENFEEELYLDRFVISAGAKFGKKVRGLENYLESSTLVIEGEKDQQDVEIKDELNLPGDITYAEMNDKIYDGYLNNDLNPMDSFMRYQYQSAAFFKKFIVQRNYNQADSMHILMQQGNGLFAAVGCAHLPGTEGVIEILRKKGYKVRPVKYKYSGNQQVEAVKKIIFPIVNNTQQVTPNITVKAPGKLYEFYSNNVSAMYGHVDMKNGAFYLLARLHNNAGFYNKNSSEVLAAIDSLLFTNVRGQLQSKKIGTYKGYPSVDVTTLVKNKDIERYRFIVTPYEVYRLHVGGKDKYANQPEVTEFFNSVDFKDANELTATQGFTQNQKLAFNVWTGTNNNQPNTVVKYRNYNAAQNVYQCITQATVTQNDGPLADSLISHMVRESFLKSDMFPFDVVNDLKVFPYQLNKINSVTTKFGNTIQYKIVYQAPYLYFIYVHAKNPTDTSFFANFKVTPPANTNAFAFTDVQRSYTVQLPYQQQFDAAWKTQTERERKKFDDNKEPNAERNLKAAPSENGNNAITDNLRFTNPNTFEDIELTYVKLDSLLTYPKHVSQFWATKVPLQKENKFSYNYTTTRYNDYNRYDGDRYNNYSNESFTWGNPQNIVYDTAKNKSIQSVKFIYYDSLNKTKHLHHYYLTNSKFYHLKSQVFADTLSAFQKQVFSSFTPTTNPNQAIAVFTPKLASLVQQYNNTPNAKKPSVLQKLNNINLGVTDITVVDSIYKTLTPNLREHNILKIKLMDMLYQGTYADSTWPQLSTWYKKIINNASASATEKNAALDYILEKQHATDLAWLTEQYVLKTNIQAVTKKYKIIAFLKEVYPKNNAQKNIPITIATEADLDYFTLIDSGYLTAANKAAAFKLIKEMVEKMKFNFQLKQEADLFKFNKKELDENATTDAGNSYSSYDYDRGSDDVETDGSDFKTLLKAYKYFYETNPTDAFFTEAFERIKAANIDEDALDLAEILLQFKTKDWTKINSLIAQVTKGNKNIFRVNKLFAEHEVLPYLNDTLKNKSVLLKDILLAKFSGYEKLESVQFLQTEINPLTKDTVYFYNYKKEKENKFKVAYLAFSSIAKLLDAETSYKALDYEYTNEIIEGDDTYERISKKLMRKMFLSANGKGGGYYNDYGNDTKSLYSID